MTGQPIEFKKSPNAILDYRFDWSRYLKGTRAVDAIASSSWIVTPEGTTIVKSEQTPDATSVWISGGTTGTRYKVTCRITTHNSRTDERSFFLHIQEQFAMR